MRAKMAKLWPKMWFSIWRPPTSWILLDTSSEGKCCPGTLLSVSVSNLVQICSKMVQLWPCNWYQNGGRHHLGFLHYVNFGGKSDCRTPFSTYISNSVQMRPKMAELWPKMWFPIWRPPPSWILLNTSSDGKSCPGTLLSVSVSNLVQIRSKMAELWPFDGFQDGGRRHLELLFRNHGPPTKSTWRPEHCVKVLFQSLYYFPRYGHLKILLIWLKTPIPAPDTCVFGGFWTPNIIFRHRDPQKTHPWVNPRRLRYTWWKSVHPFLL